ncbi:MAG: DUF4301 family protein [Calditrichia bacterium]
MNDKLWDFTEADLKQIRRYGIKLDEIKEQLRIFRTGLPPIKLKRPCTLGDGINRIDERKIDYYLEKHRSAAAEGRMLKFVPASGSATRMFKKLQFIYNNYNQLNELEKAGAKEVLALKDFINNLEKFAFFEELKARLSRNGLRLEKLIIQKDYRTILDYVLNPVGLNYANLPKGLILFHRYPDRPRTAFEEHLVEAKHYVLDSQKQARIHFTVSREHLKLIQSHLKSVRKYHETDGVQFRISYSVQSKSTHTIAVDLENRPLREPDGTLVFRPAGHGALLQNLNELQGDIIYIKNIDNVVPDHLKEPTYTYKKILGGVLIELQEQVFHYIHLLKKTNPTVGELEEIARFVTGTLSVPLPEGFSGWNPEDKQQFLLERLNRPLRVCGMVKNVGEPGGGPFWVEGTDGKLSKQIVESAQVDFQSEEQRRIFQAATHFSPTDLVCAVRDYRGEPFNLMQYRDPTTGFITIKSKDGQDLKALELPGLWNGSMAYWNSYFVEVPVITFNPVKEVLDLLRREHQPQD